MLHRDPPPAGLPLPPLFSPSRSRLTLVRTGWLGLGPRCRGMPPGCYKQGSGRLPPTPRLMGAWRSTVSKCMGVDPDVPAALEPLQLLVVDRLYDSGRWVRVLWVCAGQRGDASRDTPQLLVVGGLYASRRCGCRGRA